MNQIDAFEIPLSRPAASFVRRDAERRRDDGIRNAIRRADRTDEGWSASARAALLEFLAKQGRAPFLAESVRTWAESKGIVRAPTDGRAWGHVMQAAKRNGIVVACGYAPANSSNRSPKVQWVAP